MSNRKRRSSQVLAPESSDGHDDVRRKMKDAIAPRDMLESMIADDLAHTSSFALDLGRAGEDVVTAAMPEALYAILTRYQLGISDEERVSLVQNWLKEDAIARAMVAGLLKQVGLNESSIRAQAIAMCLPTLSAIENLRSSASNRRNRGVEDIVLWRRFQELQMAKAAKAERVREIEDLSNGAEDDN